ncbi:hypothetical protein B0H19DRAFT_1234220 [Mycena capillaripes]|nr:hypothetical protein B0H19DRAFT_1234220 [Mycena capillaripes]
MGSKDRIPNELWSEMFGHLTKDSLAVLSQTNHFFRDISRAHLFSSFDFHPYALEKHDRLLLPPSDIVQRAKDRLAFWSSAEIAPFVRSCQITPWDQDRRRGPKFSASAESYTLLNAFFESLAHFSGLQSIDATYLHFTQVGVANLCNLPDLRTLRVSDYRVAPGQVIDTSSLELQHLSRFELRGGRLVSSPGNDWIPLLPPNELVELKIWLAPNLASAFEDLPSFAQAHKLSISGLDASDTIRLLSKFPALQVLSMRPAEHRNNIGIEPSTTPPILPQLKEYSGVYQTLSMFLPLPTLTHVTVPHCHPHPLIAELREIRAPVNATSFCVDFISVPDANINSFFDVFRSLTRLRLNIADVLPLDFDMDGDGDDYPEGIPNWKIHQFLETLVKSTLPPRLEQLAVFWKIEDECIPSLPDFNRSSARLMKTFPTLKAVWLGLYGLTFRATRLPDGRPVGKKAVANQNHATVKRMCAEFNSSWGDLESSLRSISDLTEFTVNEE